MIVGLILEALGVVAFFAAPFILIGVVDRLVQRERAASSRCQR